MVRIGLRVVRRVLGVRAGEIRRLSSGLSLDHARRTVNANAGKRLIDRRTTGAYVGNQDDQAEAARNDHVSAQPDSGPQEPPFTHLGLVGVQSSAGAHTPGQEKAARALRDAGLVEQIEGAGCTVIDHGDLPPVRSRPDAGHRRAQNLPLAADVARSVADRVESIIGAGQIPLVFGGDCTVTVGVVSGLLRAGQDPSLLYFDGGVDLYIPATQPEGHLDSMGVAHMIGEPGAAPELSRIGPRYPMLAPSRVVFYGPCLDHTDESETRVLARHGMRAYPLDRVVGRPKGAAAEARAAVESDGGPFLIHFDVDVLDFVDCPIADVPHYEHGLTLADAMASLRVLVASPRFAGLVVTEINPDHADAEGVEIGRFVRALAEAFGDA
jgi:arginase